MKVKKKMNLGIFISDLGKAPHFGLGIGAEIRPQNQPRKIPGSVAHRHACDIILEANREIWALKSYFVF